MTIVRLWFQRDLSHYLLLLDVFRDEQFGVKKKMYGNFWIDVYFNIRLVQKNKCVLTERFAYLKKRVIQRVQTVITRNKLNSRCSYYLFRKQHPRYDLTVEDLYVHTLISSNRLLLGSCELELSKQERRKLIVFQRRLIATIISCIFATQFFAFARFSGMNDMRKKCSFPTRELLNFILKPTDISYGEPNKDLLQNPKSQPSAHSIVFSTSYRRGENYQTIYVYYKSARFSFNIPIRREVRCNTEEWDEWGSDSERSSESTLPDTETDRDSNLESDSESEEW